MQFLRNLDLAMALVGLPLIVFILLKATHLIG